ncbi:hypothetical protein [Actinokineospora terrae]|uniref:Tetratricopeptide repeat-containing protein n=1 Tax=Actinokineospora terrae TaxID=155974 RepID=A0A1H9RU85_9PSEU|nr:hypothetical protein [Actinokineospora terrae]SER76276.1 hypothetical protein SAMN04487818_10596 [Actinokineospora terrae]
MHERPARTLLEHLIRDRNLTYEECAEALERLAHDTGEPGTLSARHLQRLAAGRRPDGSPLAPPRPATARLLERFFEHNVKTLLRPPAYPVSHDGAAELRRLVHLSSRVDMSVVDLLREQLAYLRRLDRQFGALVTSGEVRAKIEQTRRLKAHSLLPAVRAPLAAIESELCTLAGWQALDCGDPLEAWRFYEDARVAAREVPDPSWLVHATAEQAIVLIDLDQPTDAVDLLASLDPANSRALPSGIRSWCLAALGEAYAAAGDTRLSLTSFDQAEQLLTASTPEAGPYVALDTTHLTRWRGHALARLGRREAHEVLTAVLADLDPTFVRAATGLRIDLALIHCSMKDFDQASSHAKEAAAVAAEIGSNRQVIRALALV